MSATQHCSAWMCRLVTSGATSCLVPALGLMLATNALAQTDNFDNCEFLPPPTQTLGPDYSLVDAMVTEGAPPGARIFRPLCVGHQAPKVTWLEARPKWQVGQSRDITVARRVFFAKPKNSTRLVLPLIIWSHPQGDTDVLEPGTSAYDRVAALAIERGYAFMSLQFRHPTASQRWYPAPPGPPNQNTNGSEPPNGTMYPSTDIATAVQWARYNSGKLLIDPANVFLVGQSRGSLSVLTALMGDQKKTTLGVGDPPYLAESSLPNAVFAPQAQTTYRDDQLKSFFIKRWAAQTVTNRIITKQLQFPLCREFTNPNAGRFDYWCHYDRSTQDFSNSITTPLSSFDALDANDKPPIWIRYDRTPATTNTITLSGLYVNNKGDYQDNPDIDNNAANCYETTVAPEAVLKCFDVHHPNFGVKIRQKWLGFTNPVSYVFVQYAPTNTAQERAEAGIGFFDNYYCFFMSYRTANGVFYDTLTNDGDAKRVASINAENIFRPPNQQITTAKCALAENDVWPAN